MSMFVFLPFVAGATAGVFITGPPISLSRRCSARALAIECLAKEPNRPPHFGKPRKLAWSFLSDDEPPDEETERRSIIRERGEEEDDGTYVRGATSWNQRAAKQKTLWRTPEYREATLAKRNATAAGRGKLPQEPAAKQLSPSAQLRSGALRLKHHDEEAWMKQRLASGEEWRAGRNNHELKAAKQRKRAELARQRYAKRRAAATAATAVEAEAAAKDRTDQAPGTMDS